MIKSEAIPDGFEPEHAFRSSSGDLSADRFSSDLNHVAEDLSDQLKNVGSDEVTKEMSGMMITVSESNGGLDSKRYHDEEGRDGDGDGWSQSETEDMVEKRDFVYPVRPGAEDCSFYMRNGSCKFGSSCKFNHPLLKKTQFYFRTGGCKYGETCRFNHTKPKTFQASVPELNFLGLPIRLGEIECSFYMRNGSCKFGVECKFNHPDPTTIGGTDTPSVHGINGGSIASFSPKSTFQASPTSWNSPRHVNGTSPFIPAMLSQTRGVPSKTPEWNGHQASVYSSERSMFSPSTTYLMNNPSAETSRLSQYQYQMPAEEFPERPGQPECGYYLKTGDCKFKFTCKFHHPKNRLPKQPPYALNDKGLPLRPDQNICTHYIRYGICKFGPACRFDHSVQPSYPTESPQAVAEPPRSGGNGNESDGWN